MIEVNSSSISTPQVSDAWAPVCLQFSSALAEALTSGRHAV